MASRMRALHDHVIIPQESVVQRLLATSFSLFVMYNVLSKARISADSAIHYLGCMIGLLFLHVTRKIYRRESTKAKTLR
jgi:hypothetical protein